MNESKSLAANKKWLLHRIGKAKTKNFGLLFFLVLAGLVLIHQSSVIVDSAYTCSIQQTVGNVAITASSPWDIAIRQAEELLSNTTFSIDGTNLTQEDLPLCFVPNKEKTSALVRNARASSTNPAAPLLPLPVMNLGMPKCGSTTLYNFFDCVGLNSTHWDRKTRYFEGLCMRDAANIGLPPIKTCGPETDAFMQFDVAFPFGFGYDKFQRFDSRVERDDCFFPQLSLLEEIHAENPKATFVMNFRPIHDWIRSVRGWRDMLTRFRECHLPNLPRGHPAHVKNKTDVFSTMAQFFCSHVQHVRNFVEAHPSHALIELDLYDNDHSRDVMSAFFPSSPGKQQSSECWGHENKSEERFKKTQIEEKKTPEPEAGGPSSN